MCACSSDKTSSPGSSDSSATVHISSPVAASSFEITPDMTDIDVVVTETDFTLVPLGMEGSDMSQGQVRLYVDGMSCDDPGGDDPGEPAMPVDYNRILPNATGENTIGMDYCAGGVPAVDDKDHVLEAQLWHGTTPLLDSTGATIKDDVSFHTTFSATAGAAGAASN
jgi:hypothetical protein